jgi:hypothetical protein
MIDDSVNFFITELDNCMYAHAGRSIARLWSCLIWQGIKLCCWTCPASCPTKIGIDPVDITYNLLHLYLVS